MEGIDWFNISSEKAEAVLPFLLSKLHDEQFIIAAQFLLCQPDLIRECPNREQLLRKLDERREQNRKAGKNVLKRLRWYQADKKQRLGRLSSRRNRADFNQTHNRVYSNGSSPYDRPPRQNNWRFNSDPTDFNPEEGSVLDAFASTKRMGKWGAVPATKEKYKRSIERSAKDFEDKKSFLLCSQQVAVNYRYRSVFEEVFTIVWDLPEHVADILIMWCSSALEDDVKRNGRKLKRTPAFRKKFSHSLDNTVKRVAGAYKKKNNGKLVRVLKVQSDGMCSVRFTRSKRERKLPLNCLVDIDDTFLDITSGIIKHTPERHSLVDMSRTFVYNIKSDSKISPQLWTDPMQKVIRSRWPNKEQLQNAAPLEDWEFEMLRFLKNKRTLNSREMNLLSKLMARDGRFVSKESNVESRQRRELDEGEKKETSENDDVSGDTLETNL